MTSLRLAAVDVPVVVLALLVLLVWAEQEEESCAADQNCPMGEEEKEVHNERKSQDLDIHEVYERLRQKMKRVKAACGSLCRTWSSEATSEGVTAEDLDTDYSRVTPLKKEVNCNALFLSPDMDAEAETLRPLMKGRVPVEYTQYFDDARMKLNERDYVWTEALINDLMKNVVNKPVMYSVDDVRNVQRHLNQVMDIVGKRILVVGSQKPWIEALLLAGGAANVVTVEYQSMKSLHPNVSIVTPKQLGDAFVSGELELFDAVVSFSSIEHSGLGRYGDDLNPFGDLIAMAKAWCVVKHGGQALIGIPVGRTDKVHFNGCKLYSRIQLPHLFANWNLVHTEANGALYHKRCYWCYQPLFLLEKP